MHCPAISSAQRLFSLYVDKSHSRRFRIVVIFWFHPKYFREEKILQRAIGKTATGFRIEASNHHRCEREEAQIDIAFRLKTNQTDGTREEIASIWQAQTQSTVESLRDTDMMQTAVANGKNTPSGRESLCSVYTHASLKQCLLVHQWHLFVVQ